MNLNFANNGLIMNSLTVHHSLHCLVRLSSGASGAMLMLLNVKNMLRMGIYKDYYLFPEDAAKREFTWIHLGTS
jgi:hypothetical protein